MIEFFFKKNFKNSTEVLPINMLLLYQSSHYMANYIINSKFTGYILANTDD